MNEIRIKNGILKAAPATLVATLAAMLVAPAARSGLPPAEPAVYVNGARVDGAAPGEWTHDWDAAVAAAKKDGKPVFANFTGSDWCPWCKVLERQVFSQAEWGAWASNNVYLVRLDFPNDKSLVPEKYRDRNRELNRYYQVPGYPSCYLFDPDDLDKKPAPFGASRNVTASNFIEKVSAAMPGAKKGETAEEPAYVNGARVDGANPGEWTHDWDAAAAAAKKDGKPVFVNFTGSDWCGWCKLLRRQVFATPEWGAWASNNVYLVHLDFPKDKSLVPEKYRERNGRLRGRYSVGGYPTCFLLDPATLDPLGRFGASKDANPSNFIAEVSAAMSGAESKESATGVCGRLPADRLPAEGRIAWFDFSEGNADKARPDRSFECRNVPLVDGVLRFNGVYAHSAEGRTNGCNAELRVPELDREGFTVCLSFRPERVRGGDLPLLNFGNAWRWFYAHIGANGCIRFGLNCHDIRLATEGRVADRDWNWLVCSVDVPGRTLRCVLNGVRLDDVPLPKDFAYKDSSKNRLTVDTTYWNAGRAFKGDLGDFLLFDRPLGKDALKALETSTNLPNE